MYFLISFAKLSIQGGHHEINHTSKQLLLYVILNYNKSGLTSWVDLWTLVNFRWTYNYKSSTTYIMEEINLWGRTPLSRYIPLWVEIGEHDLRQDESWQWLVNVGSGQALVKEVKLCQVYSEQFVVSTIENCGK